LFASLINFGNITGLQRWEGRQQAKEQKDEERGRSDSREEGRGGRWAGVKGAIPSRGRVIRRIGSDSSQYKEADILLVKRGWSVAHEVYSKSENDLID